MLFNSLDFGIFLPLVAILYWTVVLLRDVGLAFLGSACIQLHDGLRPGADDRPDY